MGLLQEHAGLNRARDEVRPSTPRRIWVDLDNTPHVPLFKPIIRALEAAGHEVLVTARDAFQVRSLAQKQGLHCTVVGRHYGANKALKIAGTLWRAGQLVAKVRQFRPHISMSHGSRPLEIVSATLRIPSLLMFDYEHATRVPFVRPDLGVAPLMAANDGLAREFKYGMRYYTGLKEDVYAAEFTPDSSLLTFLGVSPAEVLVTIRPPATEAHYHNPESEGLFIEVVDYCSSSADVRMVILPRTAEKQGDFIKRRWPSLCSDRRIIIPDEAVDGMNLVWFSDLVISGGGTMNREAAALGVPVYSIFRGPLGAVDRELVRTERLVMVETTEKVRSTIRLSKRAKANAPPSHHRSALQEILAAVDELIERQRV